MIKKILTLSLAGVIGIGFVCSADAVPTIKKLGANTVSPTKASSSTTTDKSATSRVGAVRLKSANAVKPAAVKAVTTSNAVTSGSVSGTASAADTSRISLGKYLHGANVVKQNAATAAYEDPNLASRDSLILRDQISAVEGDVADVKQALQDHVDDGNVHVTLDDKEIWNNKQDPLEAGKGIKIEEGKIHATMLLPYEREDGERIIPIWVE